MDLRVHGTSVDVDGKAVLLRGPSGSGKSDLALRLMDQGAVLVADDQTLLHHGHGLGLVCRAPATIAGKIEVRGIGIWDVPYHDDVPLGLVIDMVEHGRIERMPEPATVTYLDVALPLLSLDPFMASTPDKIRLYLKGAA